jgi:hypothetical protein
MRHTWDTLPINVKVAVALEYTVIAVGLALVLLHYIFAAAVLYAVAAIALTLWVHHRRPL